MLKNLLQLGICIETATMFYPLCIYKLLDFKSISVEQCRKLSMEMSTDKCRLHYPSHLIKNKELS